MDDTFPLFDDEDRPDDHGLSLDELAEAFASLMRQGDDPYEQPPDDAEDLPGDPDTDALWATLASATLGGVASSANAPSHAKGGAGSEPGEQPTSPDATGGNAAVGSGMAASLARLRRQPNPEDAAVVTPRSIVEAALFVGRPDGAALGREPLAAVMRGVTPDEIDAIVAELNADYDALGCPYHIVGTGEGYRMTLRAAFEGLGRRLAGRVREVRLSQAAVDVLAIIAYHQPITREGVDRLRGRPSGSLIAGLLRRDLIAPATAGVTTGGRSYGTTTRFLGLFGLESLADLPRTDEDDPS